MGLPGAPDGADQRIHDVVHHHAPSRDVPRGWMNFLSDVGKSRTCARINARHSPIADCRRQHRHHSDQNRGYNMAASTIAQSSERGHRRHRLKHNHAVQNQIPQLQRSPQARRTGGFIRHEDVLIKPVHPLKLSFIETI